MKRARFPASSLVRAPSGLVRPRRVKRHALACPPLSRGIKTLHRSLFSHPPSSSFPHRPSFRSFRDLRPLSADHRRSPCLHLACDILGSIVSAQSLASPSHFGQSDLHPELVMEPHFLLWAPPVSTPLPQSSSNVVMMPFGGELENANSSRSAPSYPVYLRQPMSHPCSTDCCYCNGTN